MRHQLVTVTLFASLTFGQNIIEPVSIVKPEAVYSQEARIAGLEGTVLLAGTIDKNGRPQQMKVVNGIGLGLDEKALESVQEALYSPATQGEQALPIFTTIPVNFLLPEKQSRWHLLRANFETAEGVSRPTFRQAPYPTDAGISRGLFEEGRILAAIGRYASITLTFDVDEQGYPVRFKPENSSRTMWEEEGIALVRNWRFFPATRDGTPVAASCTITLAWGQRKIEPSTLSEIFTFTDPRIVPTISTKDPHFNAPLLISRAEPDYTAEALKAKIEGAVVLSVVVENDGSIGKMQVVRPLGYGLDEQAIAAVSKWRFARTYSRGQAVPIAITIEVKFHLPDTIASALPQGI